MTTPQTLDATLCLFASLIAKQSANPAALKRDLEQGARHFQASNAELGGLLQRMSDAIKGVEGPTARETAATADRAFGQNLGLQALLFAVIRSMDNGHEVFGNFAPEIESARATLVEQGGRDEARAGLDQMHAAILALQRDL